MALNIFPHSTDIEGKLTNSTTPSSDNSIANKKYVDDNSGGGGGFSLSSISANITLGDFQTAFDAASLKGFPVSPSTLVVPSGKTLLGVEFEIQNTLGSNPYGTWSAAYQTALVGMPDPSGSTVQPTFIGGVWYAGSSLNQGSPYPSTQVGPAPGWYYSDTSYNNHYIVNDGTTTTDYVTALGTACIKVSANTQVSVYYYEDVSSSTTYSIYGSNSSSSRVLHKVTIHYA